MSSPLIPPNLLQQPKPSLDNVLKAMKPLAPQKPGQGAPQLPAGPEEPVPGLPGATKTRPDSQGKFQMHIPLGTAAPLFRVQTTPENMQAFVGWLQSFDKPGVLGPREFKPSDKASIKRDYDNDPNKLRQLQTALARKGYAVQANGTWDAATSSAVLRFKQSRGVHEPFKTPDGKWAITPFVDDALFRQISG